MSTSGYRAFTPPRIRLRAIPCTDLHQGFHFVTIRASEVGHSPPTVAPACPPAGGCTLCSGEPPPAASRSWPCATPAGGFAPAPSAMGRSGCSGANPGTSTCSFTAQRCLWDRSTSALFSRSQCARSSRCRPCGGANRILADRQVGGSSNVLHGEERSRDHYDHLHDANPPVFGHPDERPSSESEL